MLLLGRHHLVRGGFANGPSHIGSGELVLRRGDAIRQSLSRHFLPVASTTTSRINFRGKDSRNAYDIRRQKRRDGIQGGSLETDNVNFSFWFPTRAPEMVFKSTQIYVILQNVESMHGLVSAPWIMPLLRNALRRAIFWLS